MTPFEAAFGKKPDLKGLREWGEKVYVCVEAGNKLRGQVRKGRWLGINEESKGVRIFWPDTKTITTKHNVYYDNSSVSQLEVFQLPGSSRSQGCQFFFDRLLPPSEWHK
jgi:hypothetical protein